MNDAYIRTVQLLLDIAPTDIDTPMFAMRGGAALNLFVQDMPRLSVWTSTLSSSATIWHGRMPYRPSAPN